MPAKTASKPTASASGKSKRSAKRVLDRKPSPGWLTSDEDEISLRIWRGRTEGIEVVALEPHFGFFGSFRARSASGGQYEVEIRSLEERINSCGCIDHRVNALGTCKHIEGVLAAISEDKARAFQVAAKEGSARVEVSLDRRGAAVPRVGWPADPAARAPAREWLTPWLTADGVLNPDADSVAALLTAWPEAPPEVAAGLRVSRHFGPWLARASAERSRKEARTAFEADVAAGRAEIDVLKFPLLPYQRLGALHLAFGERALLADDMGLGKTIQAIAACELLARRKGVERVLIVCPASLKTEWEEQIARFCDRGIGLVFGPRAERLAAYRDPSFFTVVNYEQVLSDADDINAILKPDIVVLDEAQRIKNWQTKTARKVKSLRAPYAFVLTGTPIENRIDELYSIVQYLDPELLGPLFRFNRDFYQLDERGRPTDYKNLGQLRERVRPLMLRRRKQDVETELPGRTVKTYFVAMADEQQLRYDEYKSQASRLLAIAQRRPLTPKEFERLQQLLACMRMICDTPAILDPTCRVSPKLEELERILTDLLEDPDRKIIVFSEWERMLTMVRELAAEMGVEAAWHSGSVPQNRRRAEINRFKNDPACRLFLSTDSGSVGLNLQVASAVINIDLPWNPAKLEQRIARAWRKNQTRSVSVVNLVAEGTIEHQILHLIGQKQALADGVIDGEGDLDALKMPSGRGAFIERMQAMMEKPAAPARMVSASEEFIADLLARHGEKLSLVEARQIGEGLPRLLAVLDVSGEALAAERQRPVVGLTVEFIDFAAWSAMQRLVEAGLLHFAHEARVLHRSPALQPEPPHEEPKPDRGRASRAMAEADRALRMAKTLAAGGFPEEAPPLLARSLRSMVDALTAARGGGSVGGGDAEMRGLVESGALPREALSVLEAVSAEGASSANLDPMFAATTRVMAAIRRNEPGLAAA
jgi:superfamily II DNA or RNA helicase